MGQLFQLGNFVLHSGSVSNWKIDCDALTNGDWEALACMIASRMPRFGRVEGVPFGGLKLAAALQPYCWPHMSDNLLIVDDVYTTGESMEAHRAGRDAIGAVVFARDMVSHPWIYALFPLAGVRDLKVNMTRQWEQWEDTMIDIQHQRIAELECLVANLSNRLAAASEVLSRHAELEMRRPQPTPTGNGQEVWPLVIADMMARDRIGREKYGVPLTTDNGRDALRDAYEEVLDLAAYLKQEILKRDAKTGTAGP